VGEAVQVLSELRGPFDLIFNDIEKHAYPASLPIIKDTLRPGGVLIVDNTLWRGRIFDEHDQSASTTGVRQSTKQIISDRDCSASLVAIRDGLIIAYKK
jgi:caffeoyl-CoA O-methyltransferase